MGGSLRLLGIHMSVHARNEPFMPSYRDRRAMYGRPLALYVADTSVILLHIALGSSERHGPEVVPGLDIRFELTRSLETQAGPLGALGPNLVSWQVLVSRIGALGPNLVS